MSLPSTIIKKLLTFSTPSTNCNFNGDRRLLITYIPNSRHALDNLPLLNYHGRLLTTRTLTTSDTVPMTTSHYTTDAGTVSPYGNVTVDLLLRGSSSQSHPIMDEAYYHRQLMRYPYYRYHVGLTLYAIPVILLLVCNTLMDYVI